MTVEGAPAFTVERSLVIAGTVIVVGAAWIWLVFSEASMASGMFGMPGMGGWNAIDYLLAVVMWAAMMAAMMLPSALPVLLIYQGVTRRSQPLDGQPGSVAFFTLGYLVVWTGFSFAAAALQGLLAAASATTMDSVATPWLGAILLFAAGVYQWSPQKQACLSHCRGPLDFLARHWKAGPLGMGFRHGGYCLGCCWALMALLFVFGVMNLAWVAVLAIFVALEKLLPFGNAVRIAGGALFLAGAVAYALWG